MKTETKRRRETILVARDTTGSPDLVITRKRDKFTRPVARELIDRMTREGFLGCRLTLSVYKDEPYRNYREIPGQCIRLRVFNLRSLAQLLDRIDQVVVEEVESYV